MASLLSSLPPGSRNGSNTRSLVLMATIASAHCVVFVVVHYWRKRLKQNKEDCISAISPPPRSIEEFRQLALEEKLSPLARIYFGYCDGEGITARACRDVFASIRLLPRILVGDLSSIDTSLTLFPGNDDDADKKQRLLLDMPVLVAPTAFHILATPQGEVATARGAGAAGAGYCYNWMLSTRLCDDVVCEPGVKWLHLYMFEEKELLEAAIRTAEATGAFSAIILTCDHPHTRVQNRMLPYFTKLPFPKEVLDEPFFANQAAVGGDAITLRQLTTLDPSKSQTPGKGPGGTNSSKLSWDDVKWIKSLTRLPVVAKGILSVADAQKAVEVGVNAVVVSNHGGRQFDGAIPAIEALPAIAAAVGQQIPVLVDSGVRTSTDICKALCLGATAVLLGRPPLWALACGGSDGLATMLDCLKQDLKADMMSLGVKSLAELGPSLLWPPDRDRIAQTVRACGVAVENFSAL